VTQHYDIQPACLLLALAFGVWALGAAMKAGDRWRRTGRCGRTGRMRWATR